MKWTLNSATIIGADHVYERKNRQDYLTIFSNEEDDTYCGVVCDGCGSGQYSEFAACLIGNTVMKNLKYLSLNFVLDERMFSNWLRNELRFSLTHTMDRVLDCLLPAIPGDAASIERHEQIMRERISFVENHLLSTFVFFLAKGDLIFVGHCGDGIIILNDDTTGNIVNCIDEKGSPDYIAYRVIPSNALKDPSKQIEIKLDIYKQTDLNKFVIATDGLQPLVDKLELNELYGTQKRQLQRKFNIWQEAKKFGDDVSCIVMEKQIPILDAK